MPEVEQCRSNCRDWCGIFPQPIENVAATAHSIRVQPRSLQKPERESVSLLTPAAKW